MDKIKQVLANLFMIAFWGIQIPEVIGSFVYTPFSPQESIYLKRDIAEGWTRMLAITKEGDFDVIEKNDSVALLLHHNFRGNEAAHIGPFFDNRIEGRYRLIGTTILPNASELVNLHISGYKGYAIMDGHAAKGPSDYDGRTGRLIRYKDGHHKCFGQNWSQIDSSEFFNALVFAFAGELRNAENDSSLSTNF